MATTDDLSIIEETADILKDYAAIPASFEVCSVFDILPIDHGLGGLGMTERTLERAWVKDYDSTGEGPATWRVRWDMSKWGIFTASVHGRRIGGCAVAHDTPGMHKLRTQNDVAILWDIRIHPELRRQRIGSGLLTGAEEWARRHNCALLAAETQNINVRACRFYAENGYTLGGIAHHAYAEFPDEIELTWYKAL